MRKIREVLRLKFGAGLGTRQVARGCNISHSTVSEYLRRAKNAGIGWPLPEDMDDNALEKALFGPKEAPSRRPMPDLAYLHNELRKKHVTLMLLWTEYKEANPDGYQYTQFCEHYRREQRRLDLSLRHEHKAGEKMFVDYAGPTVPVVDRHTGEISQASIFIAVLGASNYTYVEATLNKSQPHWISSHCRAFEFFGGVPELVVPDNPKTGVIKACRYEPDLNPIYQDMAAHYGTCVVPARPWKPRDKAKVEVAVQIVERWILAALRNRTFFSSEELNQALRELLERLNTRPFKKLETTRRELYETLDKPALKPLPATRYPFVEWRTAKVNIDYHVEVDRHYYSVPYHLVGERVDVRLGPHIVEILHKHTRVASHIRGYQPGKPTTNPEHRPSSHQRHIEWTPSRLINWAQGNGEATAKLVEMILASRPHPEQGYRSCLGIMRLARQYSPERVEAACRRCLEIRSYSYKSINSILLSGLDRKPARTKTPETPPGATHENVRGSSYYSNGGENVC